MPYYKISAEEGPLYGVDAALLHKELQAALTDEQYAQVAISGDGVSCPVEAEAIVLAHGSQEQVDLRAKDKMWEKIKVERDRRKLEGGYTAGGKWFHSDTFSRTQQIGLTMMGASIPAGLMWKTMDGSFVEMTQALAAQVFQAGAAQDMATFAAAEAHKAAMEASADPLHYDYTSDANWPAIYTLG